jgi:flagellar biosynthesis protein FlhG
VPPELKRRSGRVVAVAGGKGGVGKSVIALNLAVTFGRLGYRTTIVDADLGAPTLHTMLGITRPGPGLGGFLDHEVATLAEVALDVVGAPNLKLVPGSARNGAANINAGQKLRLLKAIANLGGDVVIVDVGAGASFNTIDLVAAADLKLLVMTPQLPSLQNAYAFLKACVQRSLRRLPDDAAARRRLDELMGGDGDTRPVQQAVAELVKSDPELALSIVDVLSRFGVVLVGNMLVNDRDHAVLSRMSKMIGDYLMMQAPLVATLRTTEPIRKSIDARVPIAITDAAPEAAAELRTLARYLLDADIKRLRTAGRDAAADRTLPIWIERDAPPPR